MTKRSRATQSPDAQVLERFMRAMFTQLITTLARSLRNQNLSVAELAALHLIDRGRTLRVTDLAVSLDMDLPGASRVASRLVREGLVDRQEDTSDRRARLLSLTARGNALIERTSRERVTAALATAQSMPGAVTETVAPAIQRLIDLQADREGGGGPA